MRPKVKRVIKDAQVLSGASARFISIVDAGANETPFVEIKSKHRGENDMTIKKRTNVPQPAKKSHKPVTTSQKNDKTEQFDKVIAKFEYSTKQFKTEKSVRDHLASSDWEGDVTIEKKGALWIVTPDDLDEDEELTNVQKVASGDTGVSAFIGLKKKEEETSEDEESEDEEEAADEDEEAEESETDDEDEGEEEEAEEEQASTDTAKKSTPKAVKPAAKTPAKKVAPIVKTAAELRKEFLAKRSTERQVEKKFSYWGAYDSLTDDFKEVVEKGMSDGVPPGVEELNYCLTVAIKNALNSEMTPAEKTAVMTKAAESFATTVGALDELFTTLVGAESVAKIVTKSDIPVAEVFMENHADFLATEAKAVATKSAKKVVSKKSVAIEDTVIDYSNIEDKLDSLATIVSKMAERAPVSKSARVEETGEEDDDENTQRRATSKKHVSDDAWIASRGLTL